MQKEGIVISDQHTLILGKIRDVNFEIPYEVRMQNIAFFGSKGSGKTERILPMLANEQLDRRQEGALFVVENRKISWMLYALAKKYHRDVLFLSPSHHQGMKELIEIGVSSIHDIQNQLVDFSEAMKEGKIIIVDAEPYKYQKKAVDLVASLLMNLQTNLHYNTHETPFFVYIDDGDLYLPYTKDLLMYGEQFGVGSILFFQGRSYMYAQSPALNYFVESNIRTTVLTNALIYDDFKYFKDRFFGEAEDESTLLQRKQHQLLVETIDQKGNRQATFTDVRFLSSQLFREIEDEVERLREKDTLPKDTFGYSVAKTEEPSGKVVKKATKKPAAKKRQVPQAPARSPQQNQPTSKIFISEDDLFS